MPAASIDRCQINSFPLGVLRDDTCKINASSITAACNIGRVAGTCFFFVQLSGRPYLALYVLEINFCKQTDIFDCDGFTHLKSKSNEMSSINNHDKMSSIIILFC